MSERDALDSLLAYIVDSPAPEHGGFHPQVVRAAVLATEEIARLRAGNAELLEALRAFMLTGRSLGFSHPHLSAYVAFPNETWESARAAIAKAEATP